ncbi:MAG: DUF4382 domain-containing protein [Pseudomonadota bacterium]|jgi:hypothetical protein
MIDMKLLSATLAAAGLALSGCGGGGGGGGGIGGTGSAAQGTLRVSMTDAPACGYDAVNVTVQKVRVNQSATAGDTDGGWSEIVLAPAKRIDLLTLTNGALETLGATALPAGKYTQLRLVLAANDSATPLANSVVPTGSTEVALTTPSAAQTGLKVNLDLDVAADKIADLVIDFDACKSVVKRGNSGQYNLKPVLSATPVLSDAGLRVVGYVDPSIALPSTLVSVQAGGVPVKATVPDVNGKFVLYPVPAGNYDLVVSASGHVTAVMTAVPVTTTAYTNVNTALLPIAPPGTTLRTVSGTLSPATATVRATQLLSGGPTVEVAWGTVDATTGAFSFALPIGAAVRTAYVENPASLSFVGDTTTPPKYTLEAASGGVTKTLAIDVSAPVAPVVFTFP